MFFIASLGLFNKKHDDETNKIKYFDVDSHFSYSIL